MCSTGVRMRTSTPRCNSRSSCSTCLMPGGPRHFALPISNITLTSRRDALSNSCVMQCAPKLYCVASKVRTALLSALTNASCTSGNRLTRQKGGM
eukprot:4398027-Alexandrium_andersonii.AAC.1